MIIKLESLQNLCNTILQAIDTSEVTVMNGKVQLVTKDNHLHFYVSNQEYFVDVTLDMPVQEEFNATVRAKTFLKLISQMTSEYVEFNRADNFLYVTGNGSYKIPLAFDGQFMIEIPEIVINNKTAEFDISRDILASIVNYNGKELQKYKDKGALHRFQTVYYLDQKGCITFTSGACINNFYLPENVHLLLNDKLVKLFKLFKSDDVHFELGFDAVSSGTVQTKVRFYNDSISVTDILDSNAEDVKAYPVDMLRDRASQVFPYSASINRWDLLQAINRILVFYDKNSELNGTFMFGKDSFSIMSADSSNIETIKYANPIDTLDGDMYQEIVPLEHLKVTLETVSEPYINMNFGDGQSIVIIRGNVYNSIPTLSESNE